MINIFLKQGLCLFLVLICTNSFAQNIKVAVIEYAYKAIGFSDGKLTGDLADKFQCILDKLPYTLEFQILPYARLLKSVKEGTIDMGLPLIKSNARDEIALFTLPVVYVPFELYSQKPINDKAKLHQLRVVFARSSAVVNIAKKYNMQPYEVNDWQQAVKMVQYGRQDAVLIPAAIASSFDSKFFAGLNSQVIDTFPAAIYVSKQSQNKDELVKEINLATKSCLASIISQTLVID